MSANQPTVNSLIKALQGKNIKTLEQAITCIEPTSSLDVVKKWVLGQEKRTLMDIILSFPAPQERETYKRLGLAMVNSGLVRAHREHHEAGLTDIIIRAMDKGKNDWVKEIMSHDFHATFRVMTIKGSAYFCQWVEENRDDDVLERVSEFSLRAMRYKRLAQNSSQARHILDLLDFLVDLGLDDIYTKEEDLRQLQSLERKAQISYPRLVSLMRSRRLSHLAGARAPAPGKPMI